MEPGVITFVLQQEVAKKGLFYPPDPASYKYSSIGGNVAECAGGPNSLKYGVTRDYVLGLEVVLPTGEILNLGVRTMKGVVGYDLTRLFVGSEGTLGVITKITLKLIPLPEAKVTILALFSEVEEAAETVSAIIAAKVVPSTIEFMDKSSIQCSEKASPMGLPEDVGGLLLIEVDGTREGALAQAEKVRSIAAAHRAVRCDLTEDPVEADKLWQARRVLSQATYNINPVKIAEDVVVPRSEIPAFIRVPRGACSEQLWRAYPELRPRGRRKFSRQPHDTGHGRRQAKGRRGGERDIRRGPEARRHHVGRARHRPLKSAISGHGAVGRRDSDHEKDQGVVRPEQYSQSRQDIP